MVPYPRLSFFDVDTTKFSDMLSELLQKGKIEMRYDHLYDDHDDFFDEDSSNYHPDAAHEISTHTDHDEDSYDDGWDDDDDYARDDMDGDHDSAMGSAGWGTDEYYGSYGEDY